ncbi:secretory lipase protein [Rutstroemia sp. NJR-2017a BBW]|nr:secretory lipase protein [Rutstroemia sp. NJR-2017a BBW]
MSESLLSEFPQNVSDAIQYERSLWAHSAEEDATFYSVSGIDMTSAQPGTLIKVQEDANSPQNYTVPPNTAVSRFIYVSGSLSGERRPVSGYVLWPYMPRLDANGGNQVVAWAHGTSGTTVSTAPSKFKNLWNHFIAPYQLVLQGYVVVATDYAGLGVAIAISPATSVLDNPEPFGSLIAATMAPGIAALYPEFDYNEFFTPEGLELFNKIVKLDCASSTTIPILLMLAGNLLKPDWASNEWLLKYDNLTANGGRKISGPLLVIQGDNDPMVNYNNTMKELGAALDLSPTSHVQLFRLPGTSHTPAVTGSQRLWMDWIADRFAGVQLQPLDNNSSFASVVTPARNLSNYVPELNWFIGLATESYQTP